MGWQWDRYELSISEAGCLRRCGQPGPPASGRLAYGESGCSWRSGRPGTALISAAEGFNQEAPWLGALPELRADS